MADTSFDCFLLTAQYRDRPSHFEINLWTAGANGERAKIVVSDFKPMFFCARNTSATDTAAAALRKPLDMRALSSGVPVDCLYFNTYGELQKTARILRNAGANIFETDVRPLDRYLMERMINGSLNVHGKKDVSRRFAEFKNPRVTNAEFTPDLTSMAVCISANQNETVREIACADVVRSHKFVGDEKRALTDFVAYIKLWDPDVIVGWNVANYTARILSARCEFHGIPFDIGREKGVFVNGTVHKRTWRDNVTSEKVVWSAHVPGRAVLDLPTMLQTYHHALDDHNIDFRDCEAGANSIIKIYNEAKILQNAIVRSKQNGQLINSIGGSVASFDHLYLPRLHRAGFVAIDKCDITRPRQPLPGGHVLESVPGLYENVLVFDFKSLYPSIIMTFLIDPLGFKIANSTHLQNGSAPPVIKNPAGSAFSKETTILPHVISKLMSARKEANAENNPFLSQAIKILMNSFYGVLGSTGCRFFSEELARAITLTGQYILKSTIERIEQFTGAQVIYGDTDSIFVHLGANSQARATEFTKSLPREINTWLTSHLKEKFDADSKLELVFENHYRKFFIPKVRGASADIGAKKHYCGAKWNDGGEIELTFKGMESARSDWTDLAKEFQRELFLKFFTPAESFLVGDVPIERLLGEIENYIIETMSKLYAGELDKKLVYKKRMRKDINAYTVNIPPHVAAAKLQDNPTRVIKYYITKAGPQPCEKLSAPLDYAHYASTQLAPIANSILDAVGLDFDRITSGQQELFG